MEILHDVVFFVFVFKMKNLKGVRQFVYSDC